MFAAPEDDFDLLVETAALSAQLSDGVNPEVLAARSTLGARGILVLQQVARKQEHAVEAPQPRAATRWSEQEDQFLRRYLGLLSEADIAEALGRSVIAVHMRWTREMHLPSPSKHPDILTAARIGDMLGKDRSTPADWMDKGILPGWYDLPLAHGRRIRVISRIKFLVWIVDPRNWIYFDPKQISDPYLKRLLRLKAQRWGDEWWTPTQLADFHGTRKIHISKKVREGILERVERWGNHRILRSVAVKSTFYAGKGCNRMRSYSRAADAFLILARAVGLTSNAIAAQLTRHYGFERRKIRARQLPARGELGNIRGVLDPDVIKTRIYEMRRNPQTFYALLAEHRLRVVVGQKDQDLFADWKQYRSRFPSLARAMDKFQCWLYGERGDGIRSPRMTQMELRAVRGVFVRWAQHFLGNSTAGTFRKSVALTGTLSLSTLHRIYKNLVVRGVDPFKEGYMNIHTETSIVLKIGLSIDEAERVIKDPSALQRELRAALHTVGSDGSTKKKYKSRRKVHLTRSERKSKGKLLSCDYCDRNDLKGPHGKATHISKSHRDKVAQAALPKVKLNGHLQHAEPVAA